MVTWVLGGLVEVTKDVLNQPEQRQYGNIQSSFYWGWFITQFESLQWDGRRMSLPMGLETNLRLATNESSDVWV